MQYQDGQMDEPTFISSQNYQYPTSDHSYVKNIVKHGLLGGVILAAIVIFTTLIFTNQFISNAFFSMFPASYFYGWLSQGSIVISLLVTALCIPVYFCIGYFTRKYAGFASLLALGCFLFVDACSYLFVYLSTAYHVLSIRDLFVIYLFSFLTDLFFAVIAGFIFTALGMLLRQNQPRDVLPKN